MRVFVLFLLLVGASCSGSQISENRQITEREPAGRFTDTKDLPVGHVCHDDSIVLIVNDVGDADYAITSIAKVFELYRDKNGETFLSKRRIEGTRWSTGAGDFIAVVCEISGGGFDWFDPDERYGSIKDAPEDFSMDDIVLVAGSGGGGRSFAGVSMWFKPKGKNTWKRTHNETAYDWDDSENPPWSFSRASLIDLNNSQAKQIAFGFVSVKGCTNDDAACNEIENDNKRPLHIVQKVVIDQSGARHSHHSILGCDNSVYRWESTTDKFAELVDGDNAMNAKIDQLVAERCHESAMD